MFLPHRRQPFDNKICHGQWTGSQPLSLLRFVPVPAMKLSGRISNSFKNPEQVRGSKPFLVLLWACMWTVSCTGSWPPCASACKFIRGILLAPIATECVTPMEIMHGFALVGVTGQSDTTGSAPWSQRGPTLLVFTLKSRSLVCSHRGLIIMVLLRTVPATAMDAALRMSTSRTGAFMVRLLSTWL